MTKIAPLTACLLALGLALALAAGPAGACGKKDIECWGKNGASGQHDVFAGKVAVDADFDWNRGCCKPRNANFCNYKVVCNTVFPAVCQGDCWVYWQKSGLCYPKKCPEGDWRPQSGPH